VIKDTIRFYYYAHLIVEIFGQFNLLPYYRTCLNIELKKRENNFREKSIDINTM